MTKGILAAIAIAVLLACPAPARAADYADDACPDRGGSALVVDTPAKAMTVANGFTRPTCDLIIRTGFDNASVTGFTLRITAKSITVEGPLTMQNTLVDARLVLIAADGDIVISNARLMARREVLLECHAPSNCGITVQKGSELRATRILRTVARGAVNVDDSSRISGGELNVDARSQP
jgi:hypothetical protein